MCLKAEGSYKAGLIGGLGVSCEGGMKVLCDEACFMSKGLLKKTYNSSRMTAVSRRYLLEWTP